MFGIFPWRLMRPKSPVNKPDRSWFDAVTRALSTFGVRYGGSGIAPYVERRNADGSFWDIVLPEPITSQGSDPNVDDHTIVIRDVLDADSAVYDEDAAAIKNWNYEQELPDNTISAIADADFVVIRPRNVDADGNSPAERDPTSTDADPAFIQWDTLLAQIAADLIAGPWDGSPGNTIPGGSIDPDIQTFIDHGNLNGLDDDDHNGPNYPYILASGNSTRNSMSGVLGDAAGTPKASLSPNARVGYATDGTTPSLDWNTRNAHIVDASTTHTLTDASETVDRSEIEGMLNDLGTKLNLVLASLEAYKITAAS